MAKLSILVIAPQHPDLTNVMAEVAAIAQHHHVVQLTGVVRDTDIARAVDEGPYDAIWWATHGDDQGVQLSDGKLSLVGVGQYTRACGAELCVLNTCASETIALAIIAGGKADMICTLGDVNDQDAIRFGILLAASLAEQEDLSELDYRSAYERVAPVGGIYRYIQAGSALAYRSPFQERNREALERLYMMQADLSVMRWSMMALAVLVGLLFAIQVIAWQRTNALISDITALQQQSIFHEQK